MHAWKSWVLCAFVMASTVAGCGDDDGPSGTDGGGGGADSGGGGDDGGGGGDDAGGGGDDAGGGGDDAGSEADACPIPECPAPPMGCSYMSTDPCTCGTLVCEDAGTDPPGAYCGTRGTGPCPMGSFCNYVDGSMCGAADEGGVCERIPMMCTDIGMPVCGCDGMNYGNPCYANAAGTDVAYAGRCR